MLVNQIIFLVILLAATIGAYATGKLTIAGTVTGGVIAILLYLAFGFKGVSLLGAFFLLATVATSWYKRVNGESIAKEDPGQRDASQVLANGGVAGIIGILSLCGPDYVFYTAVAAATLASATADTLSPELGTIYGKRFYNVITFKPDEKGKDGVVSIEGTIIGVIGATIIALAFSLWEGCTWPVAVIIISGTAGNLFDSILGATLERRGIIKNNVVNFLNTAFAALLAFQLLLI